MKKDGMRVISVVMGEPDSTTRNDEVSGMLDYAFAQYAIDTILTKEDIVDTIKLESSNIEKVDVVPIDNVNILYKRVDGKKDIKYDIKYKKLKSIIKKGEVIGKLIVKSDDKIIKEVDVTVNKDVDKASYLDLFSKYLKNVIIGNINFN